MSASFPLNGLESPAESVNNEMINPLYSCPPSEVRYSGSSGMIILKEEKNRKELKQSKEKSTVKNEGAFIKTLP